jgi:hypothetical protein
MSTEWAIPQQLLTDASLPAGPAPNPPTVPDPSPGTPVTSGTQDWERVMSQHALQLTTADFAGFGSINVVLMGSLDGTNWYTILTANPNDLTGGDPPTATDGTFMVVATGMPARYVQIVATAYSFSSSVASGTVVAAIVTARE